MLKYLPTCLCNDASSKLTAHAIANMQIANMTAANMTTMAMKSAFLNVVCRLSELIKVSFPSYVFNARFVESKNVLLLFYKAHAFYVCIHNLVKIINYKKFAQTNVRYYI